MKKIIFIPLVVILLSSCAAHDLSTIEDVMIYDQLTQALLNGRLQIEVIRNEGSENPCLPSEPYYSLSVKERGSEIYFDDLEGFPQTREILKDSDIAKGIRWIESTGEIEVMDVCLE